MMRTAINVINTNNYYRCRTLEHYIEEKRLTGIRIIQVLTTRVGNEPTKNVRKLESIVVAVRHSNEWRSWGTPNHLQGGY
jgi:hypothetical protein